MKYDKKRGYCIDVVDNKYQYIICSGERSTGGYEIKITWFDVLNNGTVIVAVEETTPAPDMVVTEAFTYPNCSISFSHELTEEIIINSFSNCHKKLPGTAHMNSSGEYYLGI